jgi:hypothetical protein
MDYLEKLFSLKGKVAMVTGGDQADSSGYTSGSDITVDGAYACWRDHDRTEAPR